MATPTSAERLAQRSERYFALEDIDALEELVALGGAALDGRALPLLRRRLAEEEGEGARLRARGYIRMAEKSAQLAASLRALITVVEGDGNAADDEAGVDAERCRAAGQRERQGGGDAPAGGGGRAPVG